MKKLVAAACFLVGCWSLTTPAYTVILKDGRRIEAQSNYRLVNNIAVLTLPDGRRTSISVANIDIAATEIANNQDAGGFVRQAGAPLPIVDTTSGGAIASASKPRITRKLVNADFEVFRQRRESSDKTRPKSSDPGPATAFTEVPAAKPVDERATERYWRDRANPLLTEIAVHEEMIALLQQQLSTLESNNRRNGTNLGIYQTPGTVVFGRNGGGYYPGSTIIVPSNQTVTPEQSQEMRVRERLLDAQLRFNDLQIRYTELVDEARRANVPPGWVRREN